MAQLVRCRVNFIGSSPGQLHTFYQYLLTRTVSVYTLLDLQSSQTPINEEKLNVDGE